MLGKLSVILCIFYMAEKLFLSVSKPYWNYLYNCFLTKQLKYKKLPELRKLIFGSLVESEVKGFFVFSQLYTEFRLG